MSNAEMKSVNAKSKKDNLEDKQDKNKEVKEEKKRDEEIEELSKEELRKRLKEKEEELESLQDRYMRLAAEFDNYKKRLEREKEEFLRFANESLIKELLPVIDNLERALSHSEDSDVESLVKGIEMTLKDFLRCLNRYGVSPIECIDKPFDPNLHQAIVQKEALDKEPNTVVEEMQKGYLMNDRLLRPSMVAVSVRPKEKEED